MAKKILVAEDVRATREVVAFLLSNRGFQVLQADNGGDALRMAREERPDLMILDAEMPEKSGYQVYRELQSDEACRSLPVLLLVAKTDAVDVTRGIPPADRLVAKPFTAHDLLNRIQKLLG
jgi:DNA-binding response OmpR family regulator